jgi:hypothetical protein
MLNMSYRKNVISSGLVFQKSGDQVKDLLQLLEKKNDRGAVEHFLRSLERSGQFELMIRLTSFDREIRYVGKCESLI